MAKTQQERLLSRLRKAYVCMPEEFGTYVDARTAREALEDIISQVQYDWYQELSRKVSDEHSPS